MSGAPRGAGAARTRGAGGVPSLARAGGGRGVASPAPGAPGAPRRLPSARGREERERGRGERGEARRGGDPTLPSWPANGGGGCIITTLTPRRQLGFPAPEAAGGQRRGGRVTRWPPRWPGCALPPQSSAVRSVNGRGGWRPSGQRGEEGGRRGTPCLFGSHRGWARRGAGARAPCGLRCGAAASARGERGPGKGGRRITGGRGGGGGVGRLRGRSRRPRAAIITEPPFSGWLCLEEPRAVGAHPKLAAGRPLCERPRRAGGAGSAPAVGRTVFPEVTFRDCSRLDFKLVFFPPSSEQTMDKRKVATHMESFLLNC